MSLWKWTLLCIEINWCFWCQGLDFRQWALSAQHFVEVESELGNECTLVPVHPSMKCRRPHFRTRHKAKLFGLKYNEDIEKAPKNMLHSCDCSIFFGAFSDNIISILQYFIQYCIYCKHKWTLSKYIILENYLNIRWNELLNCISDKNISVTQILYKNLHALLSCNRLIKFKIQYDSSTCRRILL